MRGLEAAASGVTVSWTRELASTYKSTVRDTYLWKYVVDHAFVDRDVYHGCLPSTGPSLDAVFYLSVLTTLIDSPSSLQGIDWVEQGYIRSVSSPRCKKSSPPR